MGTLVGQWYNLGNNCTGSLGELNHCGYSLKTSDSLSEHNWDSEFKNLSYPFWMSNSNLTIDLDERSLKTSFMNSMILDMQDFSKTDIFTETSNNHHHQTATNLLSLTQLLGLSRLLHFIMCKSRQTDTTERVDHTNQCSFTDYIFAQSQLERKARRRSHYPVFKTFSYSNSLNASLTCVNEATTITDHYASNWNTLGAYCSSLRHKRRHCNSESGLYLPEANISTILLQDIENTSNENDTKENEPHLTSTVTTLIESSEEIQTISTNSNLDMNNSNELNTSNNNENTCTIYQQSEDNNINNNNNNNCLTTTNELLVIVNTHENLIEFSSSIDNQNTNCIKNELNKEELPLVINITNSIEADDTSRLLHIHSSVNNTTSVNMNNKSITRSSTMKLNKSVSFADEVGKALTETFILHNHDVDEDELCHGISSVYDSFENLNFGSIKPHKSLDTPYKQRSSKFQIFYGDEYFKTEFKPITLNPCEKKTNHNQLIKSKNSFNTTTTDIESSSHYIWSLTFSQPASRYYEFRQKLEQNIVSLESINLTQSSSTDLPSFSSDVKLSGTIRVKNICFEKFIYLRLTKNNWQTYTDYQAVYSSQLSSGTWSGPKRYDTFIFNITIKSDQQPYFDVNDKIEFAICFIASNNDNHKTEYWDNNDHKNYIIEQRKHHHPIYMMNMLNVDSDHSNDHSLSLSSSFNNKSITSSPSSSSSSSSGMDKTLNLNIEHCTIESTNMPPPSSYTLDYRPNFDGFTSFTHYRAWSHFAGEINYY